MAAVALRGIGVAAHPAGSARSPAYVSILLLLVLLGIYVLFLWQAVRRSDGGADDSDESGSGGGGWGRGPTPPCPPPDAEPAWWPEFEREFAAYVNGHLAPGGITRAVRDRDAPGAQTSAQIRLGSCPGTTRAAPRPNA